MRLSRRSFLLAPLAPEPRFSFAVIADIQYADRDSAGARQYRKSIEKLQAAIDALAGERLTFVIQLGDLVDGGAKNFERVAPLFERCPAPRFHVLGNHDFFGDRATVLNRFGLLRPYYRFHVNRWHFVVLDGMQVSVKGGWSKGSPNYDAASKTLAELKQQGAPNANDWNGALGEPQRRWLRRVLARAGSRKERSIVFCHFPALAESCRPDHLLWDHKELVAILDAERSAVAYLNGHDHRGGYAQRNGVHYVTLPGLVENDVDRCLRVVDVWPDRLVLRKPGARGGQVLVVGRP